jgi:hypothetical protein
MATNKMSGSARADSEFPNGTLSADDYFLVPKPVLSRQSGADQKSAPLAKGVSLSSEQLLLSVRKMRAQAPGGKKGLSSLRTKIVVKSSLSSGAGAAFSTVITLNPMATAEQSSLQVLFDEYKVHGIEHHWRVLSTAANPSGNPGGAVAYDPVNSGAYTAVAGVLEASQHSGPMGVYSGIGVGAGSGMSYPVAENKSGFWSWKIKVPPPMAVNPGSSTEIIGAQWVSTTDTNAVVGYLKPYLENGGTTVLVLESYIIYDITLRSRT